MVVTDAARERLTSRSRKGNNMQVTIYSLPNCVQCNQTKKVFTTLGVEYAEVLLDENPEKAAEFLDKGYKAAPIVTAGNEIWSGFRLEKIQGVALQIRADKAKAH